MSVLGIQTNGDFLPTAQVAAAYVTAGATIALVIITWVLARATKRLSDISAMPFVVAVIDVNE